MSTTHCRLPLLFTLGLAANLLAQDPVPPPGGFPFKLERNNPISYSDNYRTLLDIRYPDVAAPRTGWPCLLVVHGGGGNRNRSWVVTACRSMARAGYVTLAYDTGGNGVTKTLNGPGQRADSRRMTDLAEIFFLAEKKLGTRMDSNRLAVMGKSGGGKHTLWAASYSGKTLPVAGYVTKMPKILAAHSDIQCLDLVEDNLPGGNMVKADWAVSNYEHLGATHPIVIMIRSGNYAGLRTHLRSNPGIYFFPLLKLSDVPLCVSYAYDDTKHFVNTNADAFPLLKAGVPRRYFQGTGGHGSADNAIEGALRRDFTRRWCDRFLKNIKNDVEKEPFAEIAVIPNDATTYNTSSSEWKHRRSPTWPIAPNRRFYLRTGRTLRTSAPTAIESGPTLKHRVAAGYDMLAFLMHKAKPSNVLTRIPLVTLEFDTPPFTEPQEILGRSIVELDVINSGATDFQLQAALVDVPPSGAPRFITSGVVARRSAAAGRHRLHIELGDVGYVLRKGHKLRLSLENMNLRRQPGNAHFHAAPDFRSCDLAVQIDPAFAPRLDLPLNRALASLTPRFARVRSTAGFSYKLHIRGESRRAGAIYQLFLSGSGNTPGVNVPPHVPLNVDMFTILSATYANSPLFQRFLGTLDANGNAVATFALPPVLAYEVLGYRFNFAAVGIEPGGGYFTTPPAELIIEP